MGDQSDEEEEEYETCEVFFYCVVHEPGFKLTDDMEDVVRDADGDPIVEVKPWIRDIRIEIPTSEREQTSRAAMKAGVPYSFKWLRVREPW